jgi:hypothetical protein
MQNARCKDAREREVDVEAQEELARKRKAHDGL